MTQGGNHHYRYRITILRKDDENVRWLRRKGTFVGPVVIEDVGHPEKLVVECDHDNDRAMLLLFGAR